MSIKSINKLDFIISGIPRGGTTLFGEILNGHENIYCYFAETSLLELLNIFGHSRPFPKENINILRTYLMQSLENNLIRKIDNLNFRNDINLYINTICKEGLGYNLIKEQELESFVNIIIRLFEAGLYGKSLYEAGTEVIAKYISRGTERKIKGEKTPSNIKVAGSLLESNKLIAFNIVREPFETIMSMLKRAKRSDSYWDKGFSNSFYLSLGTYLQYLREILRIQNSFHNGNSYLFRFEDFTQYPSQILNKVFSALNINASEDALIFANNLIKHRNLNSPKELGFSEIEIAILMLVLRDYMNLLVYNNDFYRSRGLEIDYSFKVLEDIEKPIIPLFGFYQNGQNLQNCWMAKESALLFILPKEVKQITLDFYSNFPEDMDSVSLTVYCNGYLNQIINLDEKTENFSILIDLNNILLYQVNSSQVYLRLEMNSSKGFTPITYPGRGLDIRELSFFLQDIIIK